MTPVPATRIQELLEYVQILWKKKDTSTVSDFDLARLVSLIKSIGRVDPLAEISFTGTYFAIKGDIEASKRWHEKAIEEAPKNPYVHVNYAASLEGFEEFDSAVEHGLKAVEYGGPSEKTLWNLLIVAYKANRREILDAWLPQYKKLFGQSHIVEKWIQDEDEYFAGEEGDIDPDSCFLASCISGKLKDWNNPDEEEAWRLS
jgi:Tfp pilus assembly protein PilF